MPILMEIPWAKIAWRVTAHGDLQRVGHSGKQVMAALDMTKKIIKEEQSREWIVQLLRSM